MRGAGVRAAGVALIVLAAVLQAGQCVASTTEWLAAGAGFLAETAVSSPGSAKGSAVGEEAIWQSRSMLERPDPAAPRVADGLAMQLFGREKTKAPKPAKPAGESEPLGAERARTMLRSIVFPGWGQAALGHHTSGAIFAVLETGAWASFGAFRIQQQMRRDTYERTARIYAGIDLSGRDDAFRKLVGAYLSSDDYNRLVVYRDAANLYYDDPVAYRAYIAAHELKGADTWSWASIDAILEYRGQRKDMQRAALRANAALAAAVVNRLVCLLHAARLKPGSEAVRHSWNIEVAPAGGDDATAFRCAVRRSF